jgi:hypothetical protein
MGGKIGISLIDGALVAALIWGILYDQAHNLEHLAGHSDSQQSLKDNAPLYALLGGIIAGGILLALLTSGGSSSSPNPIAKSATTASDETKCPFCAEMIKRDAKICRYCGREIPNIPTAGTKTETTKETQYPKKSGDIEMPTPRQPMESTSSEKLNAAINAIKAGNKATAMRILAGIVIADPNNERAWLWLSMCVEEIDRKKYCLSKVLAINPNNLDARKALVQLE